MQAAQTLHQAVPFQQSSAPVDVRASRFPVFELLYDSVEDGEVRDDTDWQDFLASHADRGTR